MKATAGGHRRLIWQLLLLALAAFAFGFALVPFYDAFCRATGIDGRIRDGSVAANAYAAPRDVTAHRIRVGFTATVMPGLNWSVEAPPTALEALPGEVEQVSFRVRNLSAQPLVGRAVPSISPAQAAAAHLQKIECFCFQMQRLGPGETRDMPLRFVLRPEIDPALSELTLAYAFYPAGDPR